MLDRLTSMAVFVKAADVGSFTAAGTALGMTSQMVGKHVAALEQRLSAPLIQRSTRRQRLTETGRLFYDRCRAILAETEAADTLAEDGRTIRGRLRVSAPVGFGATRLAPVVAEFLALHPAVEVELILTDRFVDLVDEGYDAVVRLGPLGETKLATRELARHDQVACAAPAYLAKGDAPRTPADLAAHQCLGFVNWSGRPYAEWRFGRDGVIHPVHVHARFRTNDGRVLVAAAVAGHGIILQPRAVVADALAAGALVPVLGDYAAPSRPMYLMTMPREPQPPRLAAFVEHVAAAFPV
jgi:DNA-binding transcriptional LysR family regulator